MGHDHDNGNFTPTIDNSGDDDLLREYNGASCRGVMKAIFYISPTSNVIAPQVS